MSALARPALRLFDGFGHTTPQLKPWVLQLQNFLRAKGFPALPATGEFSMPTQQAVQQYQKNIGLTPTGIVDAKTWGYLYGEIKVVLPAAPARMVFATTYPSGDVTLAKHLEAFRQFEPLVRQAAAQYSVPAAVLAGMGSRESAWGLALTPPGPGGTGDGGHGRGLLQVDDRWHPQFIATGKWGDAKENIFYGAALLRSFMDYFVKNGGWGPSQKLILGAAAAYNCGPRRVLEASVAGQDLDTFTTGRNYGVDTLNRAGWFQQKVANL